MLNLQRLADSMRRATIQSLYFSGKVGILISLLGRFLHADHCAQEIGNNSNPPCGQLNSPRSRLRIWFREAGLVAPSRASTLIVHTQTESCVYSRAGSFLFLLPISATASIYITVDRHWVSPKSSSTAFKVNEGRVNQWCSPPRVLMCVFFVVTADEPTDS